MEKGLNGFFHTIDFIHKHPEAAQAIDSPHTGAYADGEIRQALCQATVPCFTYDFTLSADYYEQLQTWKRAGSYRNLARRRSPAAYPRSKIKHRNQKIRSP